MSALIEFNEVCKYYHMGDTVVKALDHVTMRIEAGEFVAIVGQSGSGKSTCMNIIGYASTPTFSYDDYGTSDMMVLGMIAPAQGGIG